MNENVLLDIMDIQINQPVEGRLITFSKVSSLIIVLIGGLAFCGWIFGIQPLKSILPGLATMKANTAISFIIAGVGLWFGNTKKTEPIHVRIMQVCSGFVILLGLLTLGEYTFGLDFGIDQLIFKDLQTSASSFPGRMSFATAINFTLLGMALLAIDTETRQKIRPAQFLALIAGTIAFIALVGYLFGVESLYSLGPYSSMALHTALGLALLSIGILCARPRRGLIKIVLTETVGGVVLRRLLPMVILIPIVVSWFRLQGQQMGLYDTNFGEALTVMLNAAFMIAVIWFNAGWLNRVDMERKRAEEALRTSEERYRTLIEQAPDGIFTANHQGNYTDVNSSGCAMLGYTREELLKLSLRDVVDPDELATQPLRLKELQEGKALLVERKLRRKNGSTFIAEMSAKMLPHGYFQALVRDITERKQAEQKLRFHAAIIDSADDAIVGKTTEGIILSWNPGAERLYGYMAAEVIGKSIMLLSSPERPDDIPTILEQICNGESIQHLETVRLAKDGRRIDISLTVSPIQDHTGKIVGASAISRDITARKRTEETLKRTMEELTRSNAELEQFAYIASHDLQEPLRAVAGMVQLLQQRYQGQLDERADEYIGHAVEASGRMQNLINDLLELSRVGRLGRSFSTTNMEQTLNSALINLQSTIQESQAEIAHDPLPALLGDEIQLTQVLQNLIGNAIKFRGARPPHIQVSAEKIEQRWRFAVRDNGIGIEPQYFERIFLVFQRLHTRREYSGTGIGLALCKKIVERHGGQIWVESQPGQGSTFYFTIPARQ